MCIVPELDFEIQLNSVRCANASKGCIVDETHSSSQYHIAAV